MGQVFFLRITVLTGWNSSESRLHCFRTAKIVIFDDMTKAQDDFFQMVLNFNISIKIC